MLVAPFVGAWIEISLWLVFIRWTLVAPFVGAWIEIIMYLNLETLENSRSLRGSVD